MQLAWEMVSGWGLLYVLCKGGRVGGTHLLSRFRPTNLPFELRRVHFILSSLLTSLAPLTLNMGTRRNCPPKCEYGASVPALAVAWLNMWLAAGLIVESALFNPLVFSAGVCSWVEK